MVTKVEVARPATGAAQPSDMPTLFAHECDVGFMAGVITLSFSEYRPDPRIEVARIAMPAEGIDILIERLIQLRSAVQIGTAEPQGRG